MKHRSAKAEQRHGSTNITEAHVLAFNALQGKADNFALFSCFVHGEPAAAIIAINVDRDGTFELTPLFISVTPTMVITDHDGVEPGRQVPVFDASFA